MSFATLELVATLVFALVALAVLVDRARAHRARSKALLEFEIGEWTRFRTILEAA